MGTTRVLVRSLVAEHFGENTGDMIGGGFGGDGPVSRAEEVPPVAAKVADDLVLGFDAATKVGYLECSRFDSSSIATRSRGMAGVRFVGTIHWPAGSASASWASGGVNTLRASMIASSITPALIIARPSLLKNCSGPRRPE